MVRFTVSHMGAELSNGNSFKADLRFPTDAQSADVLSSRAESVISTFSAILRDYARGALDYQFSPRHEGKSLHANVHNSSAERVHLLLSGLGDLEKGSLTDWRRIYKSDEPDCSFFTTYIIDLPGYGKTRLQFEGILEFFVIYFSCSKEELTWATGSGDVAWALKTISQLSIFDDDKDAAAKRTFYMLLYSRLTILHHFLDHLFNMNVTPLDARRRILLLQACPPSSSDSPNADIFLELIKIARDSSTEVLESQTKLALQACNNIVAELLKSKGSSDCPKFHVIIDEAQAATQQPWLYEDPDSELQATEPLGGGQPALVPFLLLVIAVIDPRAIIGAGSGFSVEQLNRVQHYTVSTLSSEGTRASYTTSRTWADGSDRNGKELLRNWVLDQLPEVAEVEELLDRIEKWLFPRPRLVASLLEMYMQAEKQLGDRTKIPYHKILSEAFKNATGFEPMDGISLEIMEGPVPPIQRRPSAKSGDGLTFEHNTAQLLNRFERYGLDKDTNLLQLSTRILYRYMLSSEDTQTVPEHSDALKLIDLGITPLPFLPAQMSEHFKFNITQSVAMTEPYGSLSYMALLSSLKADIFKTHMMSPLLDASQTGDKGALFEKLTLLVLMENLGKIDGSGRRLTDVIRFKEPAPIWATQKYRLIALVKSRSNASTFKRVPVAWNAGASPRLGYKANKPEDFYRWLLNSEGVPFVFPDTHHGADGFTLLENMETRDLAFLAVQNKVGEKVSFIDAKISLQKTYKMAGEHTEQNYMRKAWPTLISDMEAAEEAIIDHVKSEVLTTTVKDMTCMQKKTRSGNKAVKKEEKLDKKAKMTGTPRRLTPTVIHVVATIHDDQQFQTALDQEKSSNLGVLRLNVIQAYDSTILGLLRSKTYSQLAWIS
ncbi:hypothetical protein ARMGADRAFT_1170357 [Armillaria gallica]|uniref:Uncharacterized protein n=1 Tax=Armillaria gallica TaxID=47427 RepID=A0A2H3CQ60_ARMGA|nr:hypothetical protein ARMGADRAFT_1170357 [Armillaria gallica]